MTSTVESKRWEEVAEGERLPALEVPITFRTGIVAVVGMRDFNRRCTTTPTTRRARAAIATVG